jgi:hypothetical protein
MEKRRYRKANWNLHGGKRGRMTEEKKGDRNKRDKRKME